MANVGEFIRAADYNTIQAKLAGILGLGSGTSGYGQNVSSAQVAVGDPIRASQWSALRNDLLRARQHQTGIDETVNLTAITAGATVAAASIEVQYNTYADTVITNKLSVASNQTTTENVITPYVKTNTSWNGTITNVITISFPGYTAGSTVVSPADHARIFFNTGGNFQITSSRSNGSTTSKNTTWSTMLTDAGTVTLGLSTTTKSGSGTTYAVGWSNLTTTNQKIFNKAAPSGAYSANQYNIYAKTNAGLTQVIISVEYADLDSGGYLTGTFGPAPYGPGVDESVDGDLACTCQMSRATGVNVSVTAPTASQTGM